MAEQTIKPMDSGAGNGKPDPTGNVLLLVEASVRRTDDLAAAEGRYNALRAEHTKEIAGLRETYQEKLAEKESSRLDSIRQVDREDVNKTAVAAQTAIKTLADSTVALKDTLQLQVAAAATNVENRQIAFSGEVNKRLSNLELQYSEGKGKSDVREPVNEEVVKLVRDMSNQLSLVSGKSAGISTSWAVLLSVVSLIGGLVFIASVVIGIVFAIRK